jgi:hypothetical protein
MSKMEGLFNDFQLTQDRYPSFHNLHQITPSLLSLAVGIIST